MIEFHFLFNAKLQAEFRSGTLGEQWARRYRKLFDKQDLALLRTSWRRRFHFLEWLGAILLYESTGYLSLNQNYTCTNHSRKISVLREIVPQNVFDYLYVDDRPSPPDCSWLPPTTRTGSSVRSSDPAKVAVLRFHEVHGRLLRGW